jgi:predicted phage baseplate assembly protein
VLLTGDAPTSTTTTQTQASAQPTQPDTQSPLLLPRTVLSVAPERAQGYTLVTLAAAATDASASADTSATTTSPPDATSPLTITSPPDVASPPAAPPDATAEPLVNPRLYALRQRAPLFGYNASPWLNASDQIKLLYGTQRGGLFVSADGGATWRAAQAGLPTGAAQALVSKPAGALFAGVAQGGVFRSTDGGASWQAAATGLTRTDVQCLTTDTLGRLYAGTTNGGVFRSTDDGTTWVQITGGVVWQSAQSSITSPPQPVVAVQPVSTRLPATVVRALVAFLDASGTLNLYAGTDNGVYQAFADLSGWQPVNTGLPNTKDNASSTVVRALVEGRDFAFSGNAANVLCAGTDTGVFYSVDGGQNWQALTPALPGGASVNALLVYPNATFSVSPPTLENALLAATSEGVFSYTSTSGWQPLNEGLPIAQGATTNVAALAYFTDTTNTRQLFAGTDAGLFVSTDDGQTWTQAPAALLQYLFTVSASFINALDAATLPPPLTAQFAAHSVALSAQATVAAVQPQSRWLVTDPAAARAYQLDARGSGVNVALANAQVLALAADDTGRVLAATPTQGFVETEWPNFTIQLEPAAVLFNAAAARAAELDAWTISDDLRQQFQSNGITLAPTAYVNLLTQGEAWRITDDEAQMTYALAATNQGVSVAATQARLDLNAGGDPPLAGDWLVLAMPDGTQTVACTVASGSVGLVNDFNRSATVTTIMVEPCGDLSGFDRRATLVSYQTEQLLLYAPQQPQWQPFTGTQLQLAGIVTDLTDGAALVVTGQPVSASVGVDVGGVFRANASTTTTATPALVWSRLALGNLAVTTLAVASPDQLLAGTSDAGLFGTDAAGQWTQLGAGALGARVSHVAIAPPQTATPGAFYAATEDDRGTPGFFVSTDAGQTWAEIVLPVADEVRAVAFGAGATIFAGTENNGVFRSDAGALGLWTSAAALTSMTVNALALDARGNLYAATEGGVFRSTDDGDNWTAMNEGLSNLSVSTLVIDAEGRLYAGTRGGGVFLSPRAGAQWRAANTGLTNRDVRALAVNNSARGAASTLYAGTHGGGVFCSTDGGLRWQSCAIGVSNDICALALDAAGNLLAGASRDALLAADNGSPQSRPLRLDPLFTLAAAQYQPDFDQANLTDQIQQAFRQQNAQLSTDATILVQTRGARWLILEAGRQAYTVRLEGANLRVYQPNMTLQVVNAPTAADALTTWQLQDETGFTGALTAAADEIMLGPAIAGSATLSEMARVASAQPAQDATAVTLQASLQNVYDPQTVNVNLNVVGATHGATVSLEVLGSGNQSQANQSFTLRNPPLTYVPTAAGVADTLTVRVSNMIQESSRVQPGSAATQRELDVALLWREVPTLYDAGPADQVYTLRTTGGQSTVEFGDGRHGARLPTGRENVLATYRSGIGTQGNLAAGQLTMMPKRPLGVRAVTNPVPATGGEDPEPTDTARTNAPRTVRALERVVSLRDYADFTRVYPGVGKAQVEVLPQGRTLVAYITVALADGSPLDPQSQLYQSLTGAISAAQASAQPFAVVSYEPLAFNLTARVAVDARYEPAQVEAAARATLTDAFSFAARAFGQGVESSEVIQLIQDVPGIVAVYLVELYLVGASPALNAHLPARRARRDPRTQALHPAQLLVVNPNGIKLEMETAT